MKKVVIEGARRAAVIEVSDPKPRQNWVVVEVRAAPMCTEYKGFVSGHANTNLGHEASGVVAVIAQPGRVQVGDRVAVMPQYPCGVCALCVSGEYIHCESIVDFSTFTDGGEGRATMAQFLLKPDWLLLVIPEGVSFEHGAMACCGLGPSFGAFERMGVDAFHTVLITGLGLVGLGAVYQCAPSWGPGPGSRQPTMAGGASTGTWRRRGVHSRGRCTRRIAPTDPGPRRGLCP
jgi:threonine dehydrogenase-like Zn-dependent dehydrogenase